MANVVFNIITAVRQAIARLLENDDGRVLADGTTARVAESTSAKISGMTEIFAGSIAANDVMEIQDTSAGTSGSKKIEIEELGKHISEDRAYYFNVMNYGFDNTGVSDCATLLNNLINNNAFDIVNGPVLYFPPGTYRFNSRIDLKKVVRILGAGGEYGREQTILKFYGCSGIYIHQGNTIGETTESPSTGSSAGVTFEDICLEGDNTLDTKGIRFRQRGQMRRCTVKKFWRGFDVVANINGSGETAGNANCFRVVDCTFAECTEHGAFFQNQDANAGSLIHCLFKDNGGYGCYDNSFLGNTLIGNRYEGNTLGSLAMLQGTSLGISMADTSDNSGFSNIKATAAVWGEMAITDTADETIQDVLRVYAGRVIDGFLSPQSHSASADLAIYTKIGKTDDVFNLRVLVADGGTYADKDFSVGRRIRWIEARYCWAMGGNSTTVYWLSTAMTSPEFGTWTVDSGGGLPAGKFMIQADPLIYKGSNVWGNWEADNTYYKAGRPMASSAPSYSGVTGEVVWHSAPAAGGNAAWICTSGTTWKAILPIAA
jgi:hypothetical protein